VTGHGQAIVEREHSVAAKVAVLRQRLEQHLGHRDHAAPASLRAVDDASPVVDLDFELSSPKVDVGSAQGDDLAPTQPRVASQENRDCRARVDLAGSTSFFCADSGRRNEVPAACTRACSRVPTLSAPSQSRP
jgi:hypothetical protein